MSNSAKMDCALGDCSNWIEIQNCRMIWIVRDLKNHLVPKKFIKDKL